MCTHILTHSHTHILSNMCYKFVRQTDLELVRGGNSFICTPHMCSASAPHAHTHKETERVWEEMTINTDQETRKMFFQAFHSFALSSECCPSNLPSQPERASKELLERLWRVCAVSRSRRALIWCCSFMYSSVEATSSSMTSDSTRSWRLKGDTHMPLAPLKADCARVHVSLCVRLSGTQTLRVCCAPYTRTNTRTALRVFVVIFKLFFKLFFVGLWN